ncbi:MAG: DUF6910 family protein, partial [Telluria sp.]
KKKPDLESLLVLPGDRDHPGGALLALGSGSRPKRLVGALLRLDERGDTAGAARTVDLAPLYRTFESRFEELNVEGAFVGGDSLALLQRGSGRRGARASAVVRFELAPTLAWLAGRRRAPSPRSVRRLDLGAAEGVAFAFTDGAALPDGRWVFSAVAEARDNAFDDGPCVASAIGVCGGDDKLRFMATIAPRRKVEGIEAMHVGARLRLSVVTDADDPEEPAELGAVSLAPGNGAAPLRAAPSARTRT